MSEPMTSLTDLKIRALPAPKSGQQTYLDPSLAGFGVRVSQGGTKSFVLVHGRLRERLTIGRYPIISLSEARAEAKRILAQRTLGHHSLKTTSWNDAKDTFLRIWAQTKRPRTIKDYTRLLDTHFVFGSTPLSEITTRDITKRLDRLSKTPAEHNYALRVIKIFLNWSLGRRYIDHHPCAGLKQLPTSARSHVLTDDELKRVWKVSADCGTFGTIVRLLIITGQRRGEIAALRKEWICAGLLQLPASICKNGRAHSIPTGRLFRTVISSHGIPTSGLIFPAKRRKSSESFSGWSKSKSELDSSCQIRSWTLHDLRRTFATRLADMGVAPHIIERLLNHSSGTISGVAATYNRARYLPEMKAAVELWEGHLERLIRKERVAA
jgi:integrase